VLDGRRRGPLLDLESGCLGTDEAEALDTGMRDDGITGLGAASDDVQDAGRERLAGDLADNEGGERRLRRWLEDHGVSSNKRRQDARDREVDRMIEGDDLSDHAVGFVAGVMGCVCVAGMIRPPCQRAIAGQSRMF
jgi:hypothetical protein